MRARCSKSSKLVTAQDPCGRPRFASPGMHRYFAGVPYSAGLMGEGSDVLGYDDPQSMDHNWGPRGVLLLDETDHRKYARRVHAMLRKRLPPTFLGFSTNFTPPRMTYL